MHHGPPPPDLPPPLRLGIEAATGKARTMTDGHVAPATGPVPSLTRDDLDTILTCQFLVAWAGERGEPQRLGWWRSDLTSEFGGEDLFRRLLPHTWRWATLQAAREVARTRDAQMRRHASDADQLLTPFALGWELDERLDERLTDHKRGSVTPAEALPGLIQVIDPDDPSWKPDRFEAWIKSHGDATFTVTPTGRRITGDPPTDPIDLMNRLIAALVPLSDTYPLPHVMRRR